jgi:hypothetical protein
MTMMKFYGEQNIVDRIKVVGVAPVSSTTPNGVYFSLENDKALILHRRNSSPLKYFKVLPNNASACVSELLTSECDRLVSMTESDWMVHSFVDVYLNPYHVVNGVTLPNRIRDQVERFRLSPDAPVKSVQNIIGEGSCEAFFWADRFPLIKGVKEVRVTFDSYKIPPGQQFERWYRWTVTRENGKHNRRFGATSWSPLNTFSLIPGRYVISLTMNRSSRLNKPEVWYTRTIEISQDMHLGEEVCPGS